MQVTNEAHIPDDEIDLRSIGRRIYRAFTYPLSLLYSHKVTTLLFILAAIGLAISIKLIAPSTYRSSFIIRPNDGHERFHLKMVGDLKKLIQERNYQALADELQLKKEEAMKLVDLEAVYPAIVAERDTVRCTEIFLESLDYNYFIPLQTSIISYFENSPYFTRIRNILTEQLEIESKQVERDLLKLDSLQTLQLKLYQTLNASSGQSFLLNNLLNPTSAYQEASVRLGSKIQITARRQYLENFQLVKKCVVFKKPYFPPRILLMSAVFIPVFLVLCSVFLHFRHRRAMGARH